MQLQLQARQTAVNRRNRLTNEYSFNGESPDGNVTTTTTTTTTTILIVIIDNYALYMWINGTISALGEIWLNNSHRTKRQ